MKVFVAGGTGVVGRASLKALIESGHSVRSTARGPEKANMVRSFGAEPVDVDLYNQQAVRNAIKGYDAVIRLTTKIGSLTDMRSSQSWEETNRLRVAGARILVDAAIDEGVKIYVHESVAFVYGDGGMNWVTEDSPTDDAGTRILASALEGEGQAARFTRAGGKGIVLRFGGFYGPEAPSSHETATMARRHMLAQIGPAANYFSSIYVPDAGRAVAAALGVPSGTYNVSDDDQLLFLEYTRIIAESVGAARQLRLPGFVGPWLFGAIWKYLSRSLRVSNAKIKAASNWRPQVKSVREGWPLTAHTLGLGRENATSQRAA